MEPEASPGALAYLQQQQRWQREFERGNRTHTQDLKEDAVNVLKIGKEKMLLSNCLESQHNRDVPEHWWRVLKGIFWSKS